MSGSAPQAGFYYQNNIAALKIIESLFFESDIQYIQLENYERGNHIDDVIINRLHTTEFIQVKWSGDDNNTYTLYSLLSKTEDKNSIFRQLADGYKSVKGNEKDFTIVLYSTKGISNATRPSKNIKFGLKDFIQNVLVVIQKSDQKYKNIEVLKEYLPTLEEIQNECRLSEIEFNHFLKSLDFQLKSDPLHIVKNAIKVKFNLLGIEEKLVDKLLISVVDWSISGETITKEKLLNTLGLVDRFEDKLSHYFKTVDELHYVANKKLLNDIQDSITNLKGGYILIEGLPGIGKSTALTKFQLQNDDIVFTYYCFIPDSKNNFGELRHKSNYFLKSMCIGIENNFPEIDLPNKYSEDYESKLLVYIDELSKLNQNVIFIIDGLDHVHRDLGFKENSLLNQIKGNLPENVFIIVSTQYKAVLSKDVLSQINTDKRRHIIAEGFTQDNIGEYLSNKGINHSEILETIEKVSSGIPLYLHYISELLLKVDKHKYKELLKNLPKLTNGEIDTYHEYLYGNVEFNEFAAWVLTFLAYRKEHTSIQLINEILKSIGISTDIIKVREVIKDFSHLLRCNDLGNYSIFHNSFREFVLHKTGDLKKAFNPALINYYEQNPNTDEAYRNYITHLFDDDSFNKILDVVNVNWIKRAWQNLRPVSEIKQNIEIAHNAAIELLNLSEFIRISFLKAQILNIEWNFDNSNIDFPILFLKADKTNSSLRAIWDGDFLSGSKEYFFHYLDLYHLKFKKLLPNNILIQGFGKKTIDSSYDSLVQSFKADILIQKKPIKVFNRVDKIAWKQNENHRNDYKKTDFSKKRNRKINDKIKEKLIDYLLYHNQYEKLLLLDKTNHKGKKLNQVIKIALVKFFLNNELETSLQILKEVNFEYVRNKELLGLITQLSSVLTYDQIKAVIPSPKIKIPNIEDKVIDEGRMNFKIKDNIVSFFDLLQSIWIFEPELVNRINLRVSLLYNPALSIYSSIIKLSEFWNALKTTNLKESTKLEYVKDSLESLYIKHPKHLRKRSYGLLDNDNDSHFIARSIHNLTNKLFEIATKELNENSLKHFIKFWLQLEQGDGGYRQHKVGLGFAKSLFEKSSSLFKNEIHNIIEYSEQLIRLDEDTSSLLEHLGEVAESYALYGFKEDFVRIYNELIDIACGVGYRKDYQASYITSSLEAVHQVDNPNTLARLKDVFTVQSQLAYAGNARMNHICKSGLISFTGKHYPGLAFKLLEIEENNIGRGEALSIFLKPLINKASKDDVLQLLAVIKTIPKWDVGGTGGGYFLDLLAELLSRTISIGNTEFIGSIMEEVKFNVLIELENSEKFDEFYTILKNNNIVPDDYFLPKLSFKKDKKKNSAKNTQGKFLLPFTKPSKENLLQLFNTNYDDFDKKLEELKLTRIQNRRRIGIRNQFYSFQNSFDELYKSLKTLDKKRISHFKITRCYLEFRDNIVNTNTDIHISFDEIKTNFKTLCSKLAKDNPSLKINKYISENLDSNKIIDEIKSSINESSEYIISSILSDDDISEIITKASIHKLDTLELFIDKWVKEDNYSKAILLLANRLVKINPDKAKQMLDDIANKEYDNLLFSHRFKTETLGFNVIKTCIEADAVFGKQYLLKSFISQKGRYYYDIISSVEKLIEYAPYFEDQEVAKSYYKSNLQYNRELAKGLTEKNVDYDFIEKYDSKETLTEITIEYLVSLFDYPVIKIRELVLQALFDLLCSNTKFIEDIFKKEFSDLSLNKIEHLLIVLIALANYKPEELYKYKNKLWELTKIRHYNICELSRTLFNELLKSNSSFLNSQERQVVKNLNMPSSIITLPEFKIVEKGRHFLHSKFQADILSLINSNEAGAISITDELYTNLKRDKGLGDYDVENEGVVHRNYNINTNFDTIEIHSEYYEEVKNSLNEIVYHKIKRNEFEINFLQELKSKFRLFDPSFLLYKPVVRPEVINWLPNSSADDFMNFKDFGDITDNYVNREHEFVTLFESGSQRSTDGYRETKFSSYFEVYTFLKKKDAKVNLEELHYSPFISSSNKYSFELPSSENKASTFPVKGIIPILEVSRNDFRGEKDISKAMLSIEILKFFNFDKVNLLDLLQNTNPNDDLQALEWQKAYTSGRRRYKPSSKGFSLKIKKSLLKKILDKNSLELVFNFEVSRSNTPYQTESNMKWKNFEKSIIGKI
ncbi:NACHT domain-containing protein [Tamlana sp. 2201CG12-4]|uniref:NACHT domain-containing protein n=1 Tax=Tamlana sp. 2201CG12-4 TaxID=3112582 RepID=UPI002DBECDBB|nr:NACHT domain-containing protein [Tamlana sp. 2201CG12-4]MEC3905982.1 NACHT domain-containing protein [Tamlana sp. 2201CG12-4]